MGKFDMETCAEVLRDVHLEKAKRTGRGEASMLVLGAYVHGGLRGATVASRRRPWLTKYLNMALRQRTLETTNKEPTWTTLGVFRVASDIPSHRDLGNQPGIRELCHGSQRQGAWGFVVIVSRRTSRLGGISWDPTPARTT